MKLKHYARLIIAVDLFLAILFAVTFLWNLVMLARSIR